MAGVEELLGLLYRKHPYWYAMGSLRAPCVPVDGGEAPEVVPGVL